MNKQAIARFNPDLATRLNSVEPAAAEVIETEVGVLSARLLDAGGRPFTLHSTVNPLREAQRLVESQYKKNCNTCIVYGFGLGYHVDLLLEKLPENSSVLVVEPQISIFKLALVLRDLRHLLENPNIFWAVGEKEHEVQSYFGRVFRVVSLEGVTIIAHHPSVRLCGEYFNLIDELCRKWIIAVGGNFLTNISAVRTYLTNALTNILEIVDNPPIKRLFGRFRNVPGILISAGPSLDKNIGLLRVLEKHAVLICVDTALGPLHRSGVRPHLVLAGDPGEANFRHLQSLGQTGAALVAEPMTHPRIVAEFEGDKFIMSFNEVLMKKFAKLIGDFGVIKAWGSISTGAFDLARRLGCDPIVFVGQDLSFSDGRYYAHGTYQEQRWLRDIAHPRTLDDVHQWRMSKENDLDAIDIFGRPVRTSKALEAYRHYFDREISMTRARVYNATEGGVGFAGVENLPLEEVLWRFARRERPIRSTIRNARCSRSEQEITRLLNYLQNTGDELESLRTLCNEGFEAARRIHQQQSTEREKDYRKIEKIYEKIYNRKEILTMLENANQGGLLTFQRGVEKLKGREIDDQLIEQAAHLYGTFFISFYQTASLLTKRFQQAAVDLGCRLSFSHPNEEETAKTARTG